MPSFRLKAVALDDLKGIVRYIAADNPAAARRFRDELYNKLALLAENSSIGSERPDLAQDVRYLPFGNYLIFYLPEDDGITVVRVLHGARRLVPALIDPFLGGR